MPSLMLTSQSMAFRSFEADKKQNSQKLSLKFYTAKIGNI